MAKQLVNFSYSLKAAGVDTMIVFTNLQFDEEQLKAMNGDVVLEAKPSLQHMRTSLFKRKAVGASHIG